MKLNYVYSAKAAWIKYKKIHYIYTYFLNLYLYILH